MRPSIAAALSTLGEDHPASLVLLRPEDSARFAIAPDGSPRSERVSVRPDGSLLLFVVTGAPLYPSSITIVGAVEPAAWTWADPKKRQPAPLARVNLDARDIHCLTQGGEIHRGATVGTTPTGLVALRATSKAAAPNLDCRTLGSLTPAEEAATPDGAQALPPVGFSMVFTRSGGRWISPEGYAQESWDPERILRLPTRTPKDGDTLRSLTATDLDALPVGAAFVAVDGCPLTKRADGLWYGWGVPTPSGRVRAEGDPDRTLVLPITKRTPKDGDRLDSFTAAELDGLPVGARFDDNNGGLSPLVKGPHGWSRAGAAGFCTSADMRSLGLESRTLVLPKPAEAPKPATSPKVGDRLRDLTPEQRANLPIGTVVTRICLGREASAVLTLDRASGSSDVTGAVWLVTFNGETREVPAEDLADDNAIVILPTLPPPPPAPKVGDKWGGLTPDQRAALPVGTVLGAIDGLPPVVKVGSGWVCVEDGGKVGGFVPERTIAFLPVSK